MSRDIPINALDFPIIWGCFTGRTPVSAVLGHGAHGDKQIMWQLLGEEDDFSAGWWLGRLLGSIKPGCAKT